MVFYPDFSNPITRQLRLNYENNNSTNHVEWQRSIHNTKAVIFLICQEMDSKVFIQENTLENVVCEMASILSLSQCVNPNME